LETKEEILKRKQILLKQCFVYFLVKNDEIVYVGQTTRGIARIYNHYGQKDFDFYSFIECKEEELNDLEASYIIKFNPIYNGTPPPNSIYTGKFTLKKKLRIDGNAWNFIIKRYKVKIYPKNQLVTTEAIAAFEKAKNEGFIYFADRRSNNSDWFLRTNSERQGVLSCD